MSPKLYWIAAWTLGAVVALVVGGVVYPSFVLMLATLAVFMLAARALAARVLP